MKTLEHLQPRARRGSRHLFFSSGQRKTVQSRPRFLVLARIWAFIHPASPGHHVVWPRLVGERGRSSSSSSGLSRASSSTRCKSYRRWTSSHTARRVNARPPIYRGLPRVWPATFTQFTLHLLQTSNGGLRIGRRRRGQQRRGQQRLRPALGMSLLTKL
jgi:hypothetical protein